MPTDAELLSRLTALGHALPPAAKPVAEFILWRREGNLVFLAGQICERNGVPYPTGVYGKDVELVQLDLLMAQRAIEQQEELPKFLRKDLTAA